MRVRTRSKLLLFSLLVLPLLACSAEAMKIVSEATETASAAFREAKDDARVERDHVVSRQLGELSVGSNRLTVQELQPLKAAVASAKADGHVTPEEANLIFVEMESVAALRPAR